MANSGAESERAAATQPLPIADALCALAGAASAHERRDRVVEGFRALVRYLGAVTLAVRIQYGPGPGDEPASVQELIRQLRGRGLTDGQWVNLIRSSLRSWQGREGYPVPGLVELFHGHHKGRIARAIDGLLEMRKVETVAHGATGSADGLGEVLERREPQLAGLIEAFAPSWDAARLVVPLALPEPGEAQPAWSLAGYTPPRGRWARCLLAPGERLPPGQPVLVDPEGKPRVALHPVALFRRPSPEAVEELFVLDGARKRAARFVAVPSMAEHRETEVWGSLASALLEDAGDEEAPAAPGQGRPYRGLARFGAEHAALFFGRERQAENLANRIRRHPMITVTGPSGSGKSSLLEAGVLPLLADLTCVRLRPGRDPLGTLALRLGEQLEGDPAAARALREVIRERPETLGLHLDRWARAGDRGLLLIIDQAEELFTLCDDPGARAGFAEALASVGLDPDGRTRVVLSLREDFFARMAELPPLRGAYSQQVEVVATPDAGDLVRILVQPARLFGVELEDEALVTEMVGAVAGEPAALAMLQFCADQLWERRDRAWKRLTWDAYRAVGGVEGALAVHADATVAALTPRRRAAARRMLLRLVTPERTRAVVAEDELCAGAGADAGEVLSRLCDARLVTRREPDDGRGGAVVELVHEALIRHWEALARWLTEDDEMHRVRARVAGAAARWFDEGRAADLLLGHGKPLLEAEELARARSAELGERERAFIDASIARGRRRRRVKQGAIAGLAALALVAALFGGFAWRERGRAERSAVAARESAVQANDRTVALLREQGRRELMAGRAERALVYLAEAYSRGGRGAALRSLLADAVRPVDALEHVLDAHGAAVRAARFDAGGGRVVTASYDGTARIWDVSSGALIASLDDHGDVVADVAVAHDTVVTAGHDGTVRLWSLANGTAGAVLEGHEARVTAVAVAAAGDRIASGSWDGSARLWNLRSGRVIARLEHGGDVLAVAFSPDGTLLATGAADGRVRLWEAGAGEPVGVLEGHGRAVRALSFSADGTRLASASGDGTARVWDPIARSAVATLVGHRGDLDGARFDPGGTRVVTAGSDGTARLWDAATGAELAVLRGHGDWASIDELTSSAVVSAAFDPAGALVLTAGVDGTARIWDAATGAPLVIHAGHRGRTRAAFDPAGQRIITADASGGVRLWQASSGKLVARLDAAGGTDPGHLRAVRDLRADGERITALTGAGAASWSAGDWQRQVPPPGQIVALTAAGAAVTQSDDGTLAVGGEALTGDAGALTAVAVCDDAVVTGGRDGLVHRWRGGERRSLGAPGPPVAAVACTEGGALVAAAARDGRVRIWDGPGGVLLHATDAPERAVSLRPSVRFDVAGEVLLVATVDLEVALLEARTGRLVAALEGQDGWFHPDGRVLTVDGDRRTARLWDRSGALLATLEGHTDQVRAAAFDAAGERIVTAGADGARVWSASGAELLAILPVPAPVEVARFDPSGARVITGDAAGQIRIWDVGGETRPPAAIAAVVATRVPWRLIEGRLVPRELP